MTTRQLKGATLVAIGAAGLAGGLTHETPIALELLAAVLAFLAVFGVSKTGRRK